MILSGPQAIKNKKIIIFGGKENEKSPCIIPCSIVGDDDGV